MRANDKIALIFIFIILATACSKNSPIPDEKKIVDNTQKKLAKMPLYDWGGLSFNCKCGKMHQIDVKEIVKQ